MGYCIECAHHTRNKVNGLLIDQCKKNRSFITKLPDDCAIYNTLGECQSYSPREGEKDPDDLSLGFWGKE